ncbi:IS4 family transposase [Cardinium endosymbiont of Oedothorax gibbosus]|uniref:IS4 family transposase n=1 Tax=Cardinium endosymbiont of Oedothorax gibbosus TaxID=931101 RepID=UPI0020243FB5|nr:IS4 family transposase [Cardinium endosymbiont of Oedothorax gibbosus]CAH2559787.1 Transposase ISCca13, IS4 group IS4 family [Cardinium endosymbiont of Oedothorax gibbosus]
MVEKGKNIILRIKDTIHLRKFPVKHCLAKNSFTRRRKLTFPVVFSMILRLVKKSLGIECELMEPSTFKIPPSKQAFSKARYKIAHTGFKELLDLSLQTAYQGDTSYGTWRGYRVIARDGSSVRLPGSQEIVSKFGRLNPNGTTGTMPSLARGSLFVDLCTSLIISARFAPWHVGEQTMAEEQLPEVINQLRSLEQEKLLFIYDRGYISIKFIEQHNACQTDFIFRVQEKNYTNLWKMVSSGKSDFDFMLANNSKTIGQKIRVIALSLPNDKLEVLVTSLFDREKFTADDISKAYLLRWHIEECYKRLKIGSELENFSGKNLDAVLQEFWAHLVMCNILSLHMCDRQGAWNPDQIAQYRLNFSVLFGVMRQKLYQVLVGDCSPKSFQRLFNRASIRAKIKIRISRLYSRDKVDKPRRNHVFRRVC